MITHSQNYSAIFEKLPASMISCSNTVPPLTPTQETGSGGTELADYGSDHESYTPECLVSVINQQDGGAPSQHDPNETTDQISDDDLTQDALQDEDEATQTARIARNQRRGERRARAAERARIHPRILNQEFNNAADPVFTTPIAVVTEATLRFMQMPQNPQTERIIQLTRHVV